MSGDFISPAKANLYVNTNVNAALLPNSINATDSPHAIQADVEMLLKGSEVIRSLTEGQPTLAKPSTAGKEQLTSQAKLTLLLGQMTQVASDVSEVDAKNNLAALIVSYTAMKATYTGLSDALEAAIDDLADAVEKLDTASDKLAEAKEQHQTAEKLLQELTDKLSQLTPEDSEYQETLLLKRQAEVNEKKTSGKLTQAEDTYKLALSTCATASDNANKAYNDVKETEKNYPSQFIASPEAKKNILGRFIELIAAMLQTVGENNAESIKSQSKLMKAVNDARLNELKETSNEIEEKQLAAAKLRKGLSIFAAIAGAILAIVSVIAAIPSGGMSLAGGIGLALAITSAAFVATDIALQFTIDFSPMSWLSDQINKGISYIVKYTLAALVAYIAEESGASEEDIKKAEEYCTLITSAILTTVILILPSIVVGVGMSQAASRAASAAAQVAQTSVNAATTAAVKATTQVVQATVESASKAATTMSKIIHLAQLVQAITAALNTVVSPTLNILAGVNEKEAADALADLGIDEGDIKHLSNIRKDLAKQSQAASEYSRELNQAMCSVLTERAQALQVGFHNIERLGTV
ncbi:hypothetical protein A6J66_001250 [Yersinia enterocolitica]|nr:hypothetical protein A6J66_001250 [Yersinia enterocolitica]